MNWSRGEVELAKLLVLHLINEQRPSTAHIKAHCIYGEYLAETQSENIRTIIDSYFKKSINASKNYISIEIPTNASHYQPIEARKQFDLINKKQNYQLIAKCMNFQSIIFLIIVFMGFSIFIFSDADQEYQRIAAYKKSPEFEKKQNTFNKNQKILDDQTKAQKGFSKDESHSYTILKKSTDYDKNDIESTDCEYNYYLNLAVANYLNCILLESSDESNKSIVFRLFGLMISNQTNVAILSTIQHKYDRIASHKFIPMMPQITAHLSTNNSELSKVIELIVGKFALNRIFLNSYHLNE